MAPKRSKSKPDPLGDMPNAFQVKILSTYNTKEYNGDPLSLMHHLATQDPADVEALLNAVSGMKTSDDQTLATFDYTRVPVRKGNSFWVLQLAPLGFQGKNGQFKEEYFPDSRPVFSIIIYDDHSSFLVQENPPEPGLPSSDFLLKCIKQAIASPLPPNQPCLPSLLLIAYKLRPHIDSLEPFLNSLPKPFTWRLETPTEAEEVASGVHDMNVAGVVKAVQSAEAEKARGNEAVARKDRAGAVKHYTEAIEYLHDAIAQRPTDQEQKNINVMKSICLSNRAAAWLMEGEGRDPKKALLDAKNASELDPDYSKAYYRQAKAHQLLSESSRAIDVLTTALRRPSLASDKGLNDALVDAYGGFPNEADDLRAFCRNVFLEENGDKRARDLAQFELRANAHARKVLGENVSVTSL